MTPKRNIDNIFIRQISSPQGRAQGHDIYHPTHITDRKHQRTFNAYSRSSTDGRKLSYFFTDVSTFAIHQINKIVTELTDTPMMIQPANVII